MCKIRTCVITVNYHGAKDTLKCIQSLKKYHDVVKVVVDNSPGDTELIEGLRQYPDIELLQAPENLGFGRGNNLGIDWALKNTDAEYIFILNNDALIKPDAIREMESAMRHHPEVGIVTARIVLLEDESILWYGGGGVDWKRGGGSVPGVLGPADSPQALQSRYVSFASGCAMLIRREVLQELGGFDERYFMYDEDLELCLRVANHGWKIWYESAAAITHKGQGSLRRDQGGKFMGAWSPENPNLPFYAYHIMRNRLLTMKMYAKGRNRLEFRIYFPAFVIVKLFRFALHGRWSGIRAMYNGWQAYRQEIRKV